MRVSDRGFAYRMPHRARESAWHGVADLAMLRSKVAVEREAVGKVLKPRELRDAEANRAAQVALVVPCWIEPALRLRLHCRAWTIQHFCMRQAAQEPPPLHVATDRCCSVHRWSRRAVRRRRRACLAIRVRRRLGVLLYLSLSLHERQRPEWRRAVATDALGRSTRRSRSPSRSVRTCPEPSRCVRGSRRSRMAPRRPHFPFRRPRRCAMAHRARRRDGVQVQAPLEP